MKQRGYPDRRGMGAQSDFISEQFVQDEEHDRQRVEMARALIARGAVPEQVLAMLSLPGEMLERVIHGKDNAVVEDGEDPAV